MVFHAVASVWVDRAGGVAGAVKALMADRQEVLADRPEVLRDLAGHLADALLRPPTHEERVGVLLAMLTGAEPLPADVHSLVGLHDALAGPIVLREFRKWAKVVIDAGAVDNFVSYMLRTEHDTLPTSVSHPDLERVKRLSITDRTAVVSRDMAVLAGAKRAIALTAFLRQWAARQYDAWCTLGTDEKARRLGEAWGTAIEIHPETTLDATRKRFVQDVLAFDDRNALIEVACDFGASRWRAKEEFARQEEMCLVDAAVAFALGWRGGRVDYAERPARAPAVAERLIVELVGVALRRTLMKGAARTARAGNDSAIFTGAVLDRPERLRLRAMLGRWLIVACGCGSHVGARLGNQLVSCRLGPGGGTRCRGGCCRHDIASWRLEDSCLMAFIAKAVAGAADYTPGEQFPHSLLLRALLQGSPIEFTWFDQFQGRTDIACWVDFGTVLEMHCGTCHQDYRFSVGRGSHNDCKTASPFGTVRKLYCATCFPVKRGPHEVCEVADRLVARPDRLVVLGGPVVNYQAADLWCFACRRLREHMSESKCLSCGGTWQRVYFRSDRSLNIWANDEIVGPDEDVDETVGPEDDDETQCPEDGNE